MCLLNANMISISVVSCGDWWKINSGSFIYVRRSDLWSLKTVVPQARNTGSAIQLRNNDGEWFGLHNERNLVSVDEAGFQHGMRKANGYVPLGEPALLIKKSN